MISEPVTIAVIAGLGGFASGLVGVGGAIVLIPLLLYVPPLMSGIDLGIHAVTGLTAITVGAGSLTSAAGHARRGYLSGAIVRRVGLPMVLAAAAGAVASSVLPPKILLFVFAAMATMALVLITATPKAAGAAVTDDPSSMRKSVGLGGGVGFSAGLVGAGGTFLLLPLMERFLAVPFRQAVASSVAIAFLTACASGVGKLATAQVPLPLIVPAVLGTLAGAALGVRVSHALPISILRFILAAVTLIVALRSWADFFEIAG